MKVKPSEERTTAAGKIVQLLDAGSFMEMGERVSARYTEFYHPGEVTESDGVITGYGTIDGNLVFIYAQDADVMGGTFGEQHGLKIVHLYEQAIKSKAPVIGLIGCQGFRIEEGLDGLHQFANLYGIKSYATGFIPQIDVVIGQCGGGMSISAEMADFTFVEKDKGSIFVNPQSVVENAIGDNPHISAFDDGTYEWEDIKSRVRWLIDNLPGCSEFVPEIDAIADEDLNRNCDGIAAKLGDGKAMLAEISDDGYIMEMCPDFGQDMVTGLMKLCGQIRKEK
jgi:acetyl-CoA carboxylase carboxyltransferase component